MEDHLDTYRDNLRHVVRPEDPAERDGGVSISDWAALQLAEALKEYAAWESPTSTHEEVALAYAEYINHVVRNEEKTTVQLFFHTETAEEVLYEAAGCTVEADVGGMLRAELGYDQ